MSHTFSVSSTEPPDYEELLSGLPFSDVVPAPDQEEPDGGPWPEGIRHYHRAGVSTRGVEVSWEDGTFAVRINTLAAPEDYDLALHFIERAADLLGAAVDSEDGTALPANQLRTTYGAEWVRQTNLVGVATVGALIENETQPQSLRLGGVIRDVHLGPRVWGELSAAGPAEELLDRLVEFMRHVQYVNEDEYYFAASAMTVQKKKGGEEATITAFGPGVSYLFPAVDYLVVVGSGEGEPILFVPYPKLPELLAGHEWEWLDEEQALVEPVAEDDWPALRERARGLAVAAPCALHRNRTLNRFGPFL
jgi:hypothetical protein